MEVRLFSVVTTLPLTEMVVFASVGMKNTLSGPLRLPLMAMYSVPTMSMGTIWSPKRSAQPPYGVPLRESSLMVMAMGLSELTTVPNGCWLAAVDVARPLHVSPASKAMVNVTFCGCPTMGFRGVISMVVLSSVATMSKPAGDCV